LGLLSSYQREDLVKALERACRYRAFSFSAVERILAAQPRPRSDWEVLQVEASQHLDEALREPSLSPRPTAEYQELLDDSEVVTPDSEAEDDANLRDRCLSHFKTLGFPLQAEALDAVLSKAEKEGLAHLNFLDELLGPQAAARHERAVERRIRQAFFAETKTLEGFDWKFNPKAFDRLQVEELATGDFIRRGANLVFVSWSGVGKSHIIQALGLKACVHGYRVYYRTSAALLADLTASLTDKTLPSVFVTILARTSSSSTNSGSTRSSATSAPQAAHLLYKIIAARNQKHSTALVTNVDFDKWGEYLPDGPLAMALLDRLVEGAIILKIKGSRSYRAHRSKAYFVRR